MESPIRNGYFERAKLEFCPDFSETLYTRLNLMFNYLNVIPEGFLPRVCKQVFLDGNELRSDGLPHAWPPTTEEISLKGNKITHTDETEWPEGLKTLALSNNPLKFWPDRLPETLRTLWISYTNIETVEPLPSGLKWLMAEKNRIKQLPTSLPDELTYLFLQENLLRSCRLPAYWGTHLKILNLSRNFLTSFPKGLPDSLETLYLSHNKIQEIPADLPEHLSDLIIDSNKVKKIHLPNRPRRSLFFCALRNNQLTGPVPNEFARSVLTSDNWDQDIHRISVNKIKAKWRLYRLQKRARTFLKTSRIKEELQQVSMHPCRVGQFENISPEWGWGC